MNNIRFHFVAFNAGDEVNWTTRHPAMAYNGGLKHDIILGDWRSEQTDARIVREKQKRKESQEN